MKTGKKLTVAFVEDNALYREFILEGFKKDTMFEFIPFSSASELDEHIDFEPDFMLLDYNLGNSGLDINGLELYKAKREEGWKCPAIFLTGNAEISTGIEILKSGAFNYIRKDHADTDRIRKNLVDLQRYMAQSQEMEKTAESKHIWKWGIAVGMAGMVVISLMLMLLHLPVTP